MKLNLEKGEWVSLAIAGAIVVSFVFGVAVWIANGMPI